jgi:hypothetical protein
MTLDAFDIYIARAHLRTIRRFMAWRALNAAVNSNCRDGASLPSVSGAATGGGNVPPAPRSVSAINLLHAVGVTS